MATATKAAKAVALHERADALRIVNDFIQEHADEILANGGALTPALEQLLDEAEGDFKTKVERVALKRRELQGNATTAKAEADYFAQRRRMWENADASLRAYLQRCLEQAGEPSVKTALATVWLQDSPPSLAHPYDGAQLLAIADAEDAAPIELAGALDEPEYPHPIARFITVERVAKLDSRALLAAYQAREAELREEAGGLELTADEVALITADAEEEIRAGGVTGHSTPTEEWADGVRRWHLEKSLTTKRAEYVREGLAAAFPGVTVTQSQHVRQR